ncbi:hypothetical protein GGR52DRAFT_357517 [Hypoxylon sp. FL1284]|nr:hypothetical protein GGR52DRAFT_357517 [Hypoxylon sp. FL1284]
MDTPSYLSSYIALSQACPGTVHGFLQTRLLSRSSVFLRLLLLSHCGSSTLFFFFFLFFFRRISFSVLYTFTCSVWDSPTDISTTKSGPVPSVGHTVNPTARELGQKQVCISSACSGPYASLLLYPHLPVCNDTSVHHPHRTTPSFLFPTRAKPDDQVCPLRVANSSTQGTGHPFSRTSSRPFPFPSLSLFCRTPSWYPRCGWEPTASSQTSSTCVRRMCPANASASWPIAHDVALGRIGGGEREGARTT